MPVNRLLKYINLLVAVLLLLAVGVVYWVAYRVLPKTSGEIPAPLMRPAKVIRDSIGLPHIAAGAIEDALFLQGYVTAQDRLWQMDILRRLAGGDLSEIFGKVTLEADRETRRLRMRRIAEEQYRTLVPKDRGYFSAYARGVNFFIETHRRSLPIEFALLRYDPRPWSVLDSMLVGLHMYRDLTTSWRDEIQKKTMLDGGDPKFVEMLFPKRSGPEVSPGSNAWVLSGKLTATGKPILANDPHLEFSLPSTWYLVHLQADNFSAIGSSLPGLPGVIVGHNRRIAWGVTNLHYDVQDLYIENFNQATGQYQYRGQIEQARIERESIPVKGERPVEFVNSVTRHGPIWSSDGQHFFTLKWIAAQPEGFAFPFIDIDTAQNWAEFRRALERFPGPGQNFVYADIDGNIGYQAAGRLPIRRNWSGDVPVDGASGEYEWDGTIPFEELPSVLNPPSGMIVTANQNPFPADYKYRVNGSFAPYYRSHQVRSMLQAAKAWKPEDMLVVQKDVYSSFSYFLAKQTLAAYDKRGRKNPGLTDAAAILRKWNGQMEKSEPAPLVVSLIYQHLRRAIAERASPGKGTVYEYNQAGPALQTLLTDRPKAWFADYDQLLLRAFVDAVEEGQRIQGKNLNKWNYGSYLEVTIRHPLADKIPYIGKWVAPYFNIPPTSMSGSPTTVKQTTRRVGPSMRFVANTADWDASLQSITIGQSGQILSRHYKDQWDEYYVGKSLPSRFTKVEGDVLTFVPEKR